MTVVRPENLFKQLGGDMLSDLPSFHREPRKTNRGSAYFQRPSVVTLARPEVGLEGLRGFLGTFDDELGFEEYLADPISLAPATQLSKIAGQLCYLSFGPRRTTNEGASKYFNRILSSGHGSVLEHCSFSFLLYGVSRSLTHELVRHRAGTAFSQVSQRYVDANVLRFVERREYQDIAELHARFEAHIDLAAEEYARRTSLLLAAQQSGLGAVTGETKTEMRKRVQQAARSCLPNETEAPIVFTANVRALRHIIEMRANEHAETEIREAMFLVFLSLARMEPVLFHDYEVRDLPDGTFAVSSPHPKV